MSKVAKIFPQTENPVNIDEAAFKRHLADIRDRRDEFHQLRHVPKSIVAEWQNFGLYRAFVPTELGGNGMTAHAFLRYIERISESDASAGWVASFAFASKYLSSLPKETLEKIFGENPDLVFAGAVFPPQKAKNADGGVIVNGRWKFGSGCLGADFIGVGIAVEGGEFGGLPLFAIMPADQVKIEETWDTMGMSATGSHDLIVEDIFVPDEFLCVRGAPPSIDGIGFRYPSLAMATQVLAITGAGAARAAINHIIDIAHKSKSITGAPTLGDRANVQMRISEAEAKLQSGRSWFYACAEDAWDCVAANQPVSRELNMQMRLSSSHLARVSAEAARACFEMSGTMGIFNNNPLSRYMQDAVVSAQHAFLTDGTFMNAGKVMFGHDFMPGYDESNTL